MNTDSLLEGIAEKYRSKAASEKSVGQAAGLMSLVGGLALAGPAGGVLSAVALVAGAVIATKKLKEKAEDERVAVAISKLRNAIVHGLTPRDVGLTKDEFTALVLEINSLSLDKSERKIVSEELERIKEA